MMFGQARALRVLFRTLRLIFIVCSSAA